MPRVRGMRAKRTAQISLFDPQALDHPVADELEWAPGSAWLGTLEARTPNYGRRSEKLETPGTGRRRGQQPGAPGHGRTPRPGVDRVEERVDPPVEARHCASCGKPYVGNGAGSSLGRHGLTGETVLRCAVLAWRPGWAMHLRGESYRGLRGEGVRAGGLALGATLRAAGPGAARPPGTVGATSSTARPASPIWPAGAGPGSNGSPRSTA